MLVCFLFPKGQCLSVNTAMGSYACESSGSFVSAGVSALPFDCALPMPINWYL